MHLWNKELQQIDSVTEHGKKAAGIKLSIFFRDYSQNDEKPEPLEEWEIVFDTLHRSKEGQATTYLRLSNLIKSIVVFSRLSAGYQYAKEYDFETYFYYKIDKLTKYPKLNESTSLVGKTKTLLGTLELYYSFNYHLIQNQYQEQVLNHQISNDSSFKSSQNQTLNHNSQSQNSQNTQPSSFEKLKNLAPPFQGAGGGDSQGRNVNSNQILSQNSRNSNQIGMLINPNTGDANQKMIDPEDEYMNQHYGLTKEISRSPAYSFSPEGPFTPNPIFKIGQNHPDQRRANRASAANSIQIQRPRTVSNSSISQPYAGSLNRNQIGHQHHLDQPNLGHPASFQHLMHQNNLRFNQQQNQNFNRNQIGSLPLHSSPGPASLPQFHNCLNFHNLHSHNSIQPPVLPLDFMNQMKSPSSGGSSAKSSNQNITSQMSGFQIQNSQNFAHNQSSDAIRESFSQFVSADTKNRMSRNSSGLGINSSHSKIDTSFSPSNAAGGIYQVGSPNVALPKSPSSLTHLSVHQAQVINSLHQQPPSQISSNLIQQRPAASSASNYLNSDKNPSHLTSKDIFSHQDPDANNSHPSFNANNITTSTNSDISSNKGSSSI